MKKKKMDTGSLKKKTEKSGAGALTKKRFGINASKNNDDDNEIQGKYASHDEWEELSVLKKRTKT